ncbi:hypothetical protein ACTJJB_00355 [Chitinophaga sp. 22536]|nr:hypothetical protein [Chitinophaga varians]
MKKKNEKKMKLTTIKVARLTATHEKNAFGVTRPTTTVIRTFDC